MNKLKLFQLACVVLSLVFGVVAQVQAYTEETTVDISTSALPGGGTFDDGLSGWSIASTDDVFTPALGWSVGTYSCGTSGSSRYVTLSCGTNQFIKLQCDNIDLSTTRCEAVKAVIDILGPSTIYGDLQILAFDKNTSALYRGSASLKKYADDDYCSIPSGSTMQLSVYFPTIEQLYRKIGVLQVKYVGYYTNSSVNIDRVRLIITK